MRRTSKPKQVGQDRDLVRACADAIGTQLAGSIWRGLAPIGEALAHDPEHAAALWGRAMEEPRTILGWPLVKPEGFDGLWGGLSASGRVAFAQDVSALCARVAKETILAWAQTLSLNHRARFVLAICEAVDAIKGGDNDLTDRPCVLRICTSQEADAAMGFLCDLATRDNIQLDLQDMRIVHHRPGSSHKMTIADARFDPYGEHADMSDDNRRVRLMDLLARYPGGRDSIMAVAYALSRLLDDPNGRVDLSLGEMLRMDGIVTDRSGASRREQWERSLVYDAAFRAIRDWEIWGKRAWNHGKEEVVARTQLFHYEGPAYGCQNPLPGMVGTPKGFGIRDSDFTERLRQTNTRGQGADGLLALAQLPRHKLHGDWAASVGLAIMYFARVEGERTGGTIRKSRGALLRRYAPNTLPETLLGSDTPRRAVDAWSAATTNLAKIGLIEKLDDAGTPHGRYWAQEWLGEQVTVVAAGDLAAHVARLQADARERAIAPKGRAGRRP